MEYNEAIKQLKKRALDFHRVLTENGIYRKEFSETEFLQRTDSTIERTARNIVDNIGDPWATVLGFPETLLFDLSDIIYTAMWDTEDGAETLFGELEGLFNQTPFHFTWSFDAEKGKLHLEIDSVAWSTDCKDLHWIDEPFSASKLDPNLYDYLSSQGWVLYPVTTGDQVLRFVLMPLQAVEAVKNHLIAAYPSIHPAYDPRCEWLYIGVPESEKPSAIWQL